MRALLVATLMASAASQASAAALLDIHTDVINRPFLPGGESANTTQMGPGLAAQAAYAWSTGFYLGGRFRAHVMWETFTGYRAFSGSSTSLAFDIQGVGGYRRVLWRRLELRAGVQLGLRARQEGGTFRQGGEQVNVAHAFAVPSLHVALGVGVRVTQRFFVSLLLNVPLYDFLGDLLEGHSSLMALGASWEI